MATQAGGQEGGDRVGNLPFAQGESFATLDAYLAHLQRRGATGVPYYREVAPGVYELVAGRRRAPQAERFSRAELMRRYGFTR